MTVSGNETDHAALIALKAALVGGSGGTDGLALSSWNDSHHFCTWVGVTCEGGQQRVTILDLADYNTGGFISPFIGNLSFLRVINLPGNGLQVFIPKEIGLLSRLEVFNLSNNALQGGFPLHLTNCTRLLTISCFSNKLEGKIPDQLGSMPNLQILYLEIKTSQELGLGKNRLQGSIPHDLGKMKSLTILSLQGNSLSGTIPSSLYNLTSLRILSLVDNQLSGTLAPSMGLHFPHLAIAYFGMNSFTGILPPTLSNISGLKVFDMVQDHFFGNVPEGLQRLQYLESLGPWPWEKQFRSLKRLNIDKNRFRGPLPYSIGNLSSKIEYLFLGSNMISRHIPVGIGKLVSLVAFGVEYNKLIGEVPSSIGNLVKLQQLTLGGNRLHGTIPSSLGNLKNLYRLGLEKNRLEESIPINLRHCSSLRELYLNGNKLNGMVSVELIHSLNQLILLYLSDNYFTGYFPATVGELMNLNVLDISNNKFSGEIPAELENSFEGKIPSSLGSLVAAEYVDLSGNNLSGGISSELQALRNLQFLNISFNRLEGPVPTEGIFSNLTEFYLQGNEKLCGGIPQLHLPRCWSTDKINKNEKRRSMSPVIIISMTVSTFFGFVFVSIFTWMVCKKVPKRNNTSAISLVGEGQYLRLSYKQLRDATDRFSAANIIGVGSFGSVYSGALRDNKSVAVKVMNLEKHGAVKSFKAECKALSNIRHRNLLPILSCCCSLDFKESDFLALVYELMPNGSLESWLHGSRILNLIQRLDIAIDAACALEYLHHDCEPQIVHCDLKPNNVLFDADMVAHVGDFGLAKILRVASFENLSQEQSMSSLGIKGTMGYVPPEYGMAGNVLIQGDTYSYGILLLEMITGRSHTDHIFRDNSSLHNLCKSEVMSSNMLHILDPHLLAELNNDSENSDGRNNEAMEVDKMLECAKAIIEVGIACSLESPNERMDIKEALKVLRKKKMTKFFKRRVAVRRQNVHRHR
uniref:non-specific serine/threonine protein kinase n=1 Tax=Kalanchoe fedtschenkoi TaxID=63787 RepID=A0A7N0U2L5_KALFE